MGRERNVSAVGSQARQIRYEKKTGIEGRGRNTEHATYCGGCKRGTRVRKRRNMAEGRKHSECISNEVPRNPRRRGKTYRGGRGWCI
jgi:hypothetical protein